MDANGQFYNISTNLHLCLKKYYFVVPLFSYCYIFVYLFNTAGQSLLASNLQLQTSCTLDENLGSLYPNGALPYKNSLHSNGIKIIFIYIN